MNSQQLIAELETERTRIDHAISALRGKTATAAIPTYRPHFVKRRTLSTAAKNLISRKMKANWAERQKNGLKVVSKKAA